MTDRRLDILATNPDWFTIPRYVPGRLSAIDFVFFNWPHTFDFSRYKVVVETLDVAGVTYPGIGPLKQSVELPHIQYPWGGRLGVIPDDPSLPAFEAAMIRGSTYVIPNTNGKNGIFQMMRHGVDRPSGL